MSLHLIIFNVLISNLYPRYKQFYCSIEKDCTLHLVKFYFLLFRFGFYFFVGMQNLLCFTTFDIKYASKFYYNFINYASFFNHGYTTITFV